MNCSTAIAAHADLAGLRPMKEEDLESIVGLIQKCREVDSIETIPTAEQLHFQFKTPGIDVAGNSFVLESVSGEIKAMLFTIPLPGQDQTIVQMNVLVHPSFRKGELETLLLHFALDHAKRRSSEGGYSAIYQCSCRSDQLHFRELYEANGFVPIRYFHTLERNLNDPIEPGDVAHDIRIRPVDIKSEARAFHLTLQEAFQDHFNPMNFSLEQTEHWAASPEFRSDLILMAFQLQDGVEIEPAAVCMNHLRTEYNRQHNVLEGEVNALGVRREFRRRGIARAILSDSLRLLKQEGMNTAILAVDSENPLGATQLYASVGFVQRKTSIIFNHESGNLID